MSTDMSERVLTVPEAARLLRIGTRTYYAAAARGEVPARRIGRRLVVPGAALERFLAESPHPESEEGLR
jgi:excisionase family DNA binding protein